MGKWAWHLCPQWPWMLTLLSLPYGGSETVLSTSFNLPFPIPVLLCGIQSTQKGMSVDGWLFISTFLWRDIGHNLLFLNCTETITLCGEVTITPCSGIDVMSETLSPTMPRQTQRAKWFKIPSIFPLTASKLVRIECHRSPHETPQNQSCSGVMGFGLY